MPRIPLRRSPSFKPKDGHNYKLILCYKYNNTLFESQCLWSRKFLSVKKRIGTTYLFLIGSDGGIFSYAMYNL